MNISLEGKYALVCGSTQGIGLATAKVLASMGATCILLARNEESLKTVLPLLPTPFSQLHSYAVADFSDSNKLKQVVETIIQEITIEILVNNTGGPKAGLITDATSDDFINAFTQHLIGNQTLANAVIPGMKGKGYGRIINIISTSIKSPLPNLGVSNTVRAAVASWAKTLSNEIGQYNITVNNILPGFTETGRLKSLVATTASNQNTDTESVEKQMLQMIPMKRFGQAEEIANAVGFMASPAASYITGTSLRVDGGRTPSI
jgi:3-oxoacyl-[acyl-carrier protein] reductase